MLHQKLEGLIKLAIQQNVASSISLFVGFGHQNSADDITIHAGQTSKSPLVVTNDDTIYDLASLTKILGTTIAMAKAVVDGQLALDDKPFASWPTTTIRGLLAHTAGFPAHVKFYEQLRLKPWQFQENKDLIFKELFATMPGEPTLTRLYSDLGYIALGHFLESTIAKPLDEIFRTSWRSLSLDGDIQWFPSRPLSYESEDRTIAPTGVCPIRNIKIRGQVHDPNCYFMGGIAGHAGLFGNLRSVAKMGQFFLRACEDQNNEIAQCLAGFSKKGIGFDKPTPDGTTRHFSSPAFGHFGFTGTSLWVDPCFAHGTGLVVALLTNRVNKSETQEGIFWLRLAINEAIFMSCSNLGK